MILTTRDPAAMTANERRGEIAAILAAGVVRLRAQGANCGNGLDVIGQVEAPCGARVQSPQSEDNAA